MYNSLTSMEQIISIIQCTFIFSIYSTVQVAHSRAFPMSLSQLVAKHSRSLYFNIFKFCTMFKLLYVTVCLAARGVISGSLVIIFFHDFTQFMILVRIELALLPRSHTVIHLATMHRHFRVLQLLPVRLLD